MAETEKATTEVEAKEPRRARTPVKTAPVAAAEEGEEPEEDGPEPGEAEKVEEPEKVEPERVAEPERVEPVKASGGGGKSLPQKMGFSIRRRL